MTDIINHNLNGVAETLLIPLYIRAMESQRSDALIRDDKAILLAKALESHIMQIRQIKLDD